MKFAQNVISRCLTVTVVAFVPLACTFRGKAPVELTRRDVAPAATGPRYSLSESDLSGVRDLTLDAVVRRLRPEWLRLNPVLRQPSPPQSASVYMENSYLGALDVLFLVQASEARSIEYLSPMVARGRFGAACPCGAGAIVIHKRDSK